MTLPRLELEHCRARQGRLLEVMSNLGVEAVILRRNAHVLWLCGHRFGDHFDSLAVMDKEGRVTLIAPHRKPDRAAADKIVTYPAKWLSTMRNDQSQAAAECLLSTVPELSRMSKVAVEWSSFSQYLAQELKSDLVDIDPDLFRLRRCKDPDELACLKAAIAATERMYEKAREIIRPGIQELEVFNALQTEAVMSLGELLTGTGNDYQCNSRGGPPRRGHAAEAGELYILDLGPAYQGYFADNARTIAVTEPNDDQMAAWSEIQKVFQWIETSVRPGKSCRELFEEVQEILNPSPVGVFNHHLGHGIGLAPHEGPHLNPNWDDFFEVGDVFTAEPGLYDPTRLKAGMRLENDYLVTEQGVELLTPFNLGL